MFAESGTFIIDAGSRPLPGGVRYVNIGNKSNYRALQVICHEPIMIFTDGQTLVIRAIDSGSDIGEVLGLSSSTTAIRGSTHIVAVG
jgi:hypothetical protein